MSQCWARSHSGCSQGPSREHLVSAGIFDQATIFVQGFDWCPEEKEIGLSALTSKILCQKHNSTLEIADRAGISAIRAFDATIDQDRDTATNLCGFGLERWLLKVAINLTFRGTQKLGVGMLGAESGYPAPYLIAAVFGDRVLELKMGTYFIFPDSDYRFRKGEIVVVPICKNEEIGGVYFCLRGVHILLSLFPCHTPPHLGQLGEIDLPSHVLKARLLYRPPSVVITNQNDTKSKIYLEWDH